MPKTKPKKASDKYQKLSQIEHVLKRPESYVGSIIQDTKEIFLVENIHNIENIKLIKKSVKYNPAFIKIYDEIITNASDHYIRTNGKVTEIRINVNLNNISVYNNGPGIPIEMHSKEKIYTPELLFAHMLSGENFDDEEKRYTGGRNGMGAVLCNIFSKQFIVECADGKNIYTQVFENNLDKKNKPEIEKSKKSHTKITFYPDFERFQMEQDGITEEIEQILLRRAVDIAVYCPKAKVYYNDQEIKLKNFKDYVKLFVGEKEFFYEQIDDNWEIAVSQTEDDTFEQVSIVNAIATHDGGSHVNFITNQLVSSISEQLLKKYKKKKLNPNDIKRNLFIFVNCRVSNPIFDTQTKENLTSKITDKSIQVSENLIKKIMSSTIIEEIIRYIEAKDMASLKKDTGKKRINLRKLDDANKAGTKESNKCMLFLTEGDSALSTALAGFSSVGRDYFGAFPLRGKPLNVRDITIDQLLHKDKNEKDKKENEEIKNIVIALGLEFGKKYTSTAELRYGKLVFMVDADADGYHIKGLLINFFDTFWPELLQMDFIYEFITPIVKASKGKEVKYFYKLDDYKKFKTTEESKGFNYKYYKGLGTIEPDEAKKFFKEIKKHLIRFNYDESKPTRETIDMIFRHKRADDRKNWLMKYEPANEIDKFTQKTTYDSFFEDEFIEFSMYDNIRSIPSVIDGLKPSQRKVLYTMLVKNFKQEVKVSQLTGSIIDMTSYHHGSVSLEEAIVGMAQDFVGSNNLNLLMPNGQYGTRTKGGDDSAASRYIHTILNPLTKKIFRDEDEPILYYNNDDGQKIEPKYFVPVIPMILVNGSKGIGTGYSTDVPSFNYIDITNWYRNKLQGKQNRKDITPYYEGFKGEIIWDEENKRYITRGLVEEIRKGVYKISELPIGLWNESYYDFLEKQIEKSQIKDYQKNCTDTKIEIKIWTEDIKIDNIYKFLGLETYLSVKNLYLFNEEGKLTLYQDQYQILEEFYNIRLNWYQKRKDYLIAKLEDDRKWMTQKMKFIKAILEGKIVFINKSTKDIEIVLDELKLERYEESFDYLLRMSIGSLTKERLVEMKKQFEELKIKIETTKNLKIEDMWLDDLKDIK